MGGTGFVSFGPILPLADSFISHCSLSSLPICSSVSLLFCASTLLNLGKQFGHQLMANPGHVSRGVGLLWKPFRESKQNSSMGIGGSQVYLYRPNLPEGCIDILDQCTGFYVTGVCWENFWGELIR